MRPSPSSPCLASPRSPSLTLPLSPSFPSALARDASEGTLGYAVAASAGTERDSGQYVNVNVHTFAVRVPARVTDPVDSRISNRVRALRKRSAGDGGNEG